MMDRSRNNKLRLSNHPLIKEKRHSLNRGFQEDRLDDAERYCQLALEVADGLNDNYFLELMFLACGKVVLEESEQTKGEQHDILFSKVRSFFERAKEHLSQTQASDLLAEVYGRMAQMFE